MNCALWSAEVFEDDDGSLKNVHMAVLRGKQLVRYGDRRRFPLSYSIDGCSFTTCTFFIQRCEKCQKPGATVGCCLTSCTSNYHFMCARQCHCVFLEDKKVYCPKHRDLIKGEVRTFKKKMYYIVKKLVNTFRLQPPLNVCYCVCVLYRGTIQHMPGQELLLDDRTFIFNLSLLFLQVVSGFEVTRRILVDLEGLRLRRKWLAGLEPENVHMMIGMSILAQRWLINNFFSQCL